MLNYSMCAASISPLTFRVSRQPLSVLLYYCAMIHLITVITAFFLLWRSVSHSLLGPHWRRSFSTALYIENTVNGPLFIWRVWTCWNLSVLPGGAISVPGFCCPSAIMSGDPLEWWRPPCAHPFTQCTSAGTVESKNQRQVIIFAPCTGAGKTMWDYFCLCRAVYCSLDFNYMTVWFKVQDVWQRELCHGIPDRKVHNNCLTEKCYFLVRIFFFLAM